MRIISDLDRCIGSGQCALASPEAFDQTDDVGLVVVLQPDPPERLRQSVRAAVAGCPSQALSIAE